MIGQYCGGVDWLTLVSWHLPRFPVFIEPSAALLLGHHEPHELTEYILFFLSYGLLSY